ncbi:MAG: tetratricopeptide repeat protein [Candidatus Krumholzibacteria bacterium]|nr:tetratricopeptide repeat protein [Candidatus Krumholzibacteria bacterium]
MKYLPGSHNGFKLVLALSAACLLLTAAVSAAAGRYYGQSNSLPAAGDRGSVYAEYTIGVYLMETGSVLKAVDHLETAWRLSGREVAVGRRLAEACFLLKNFSRCGIVVDDILGRNPNDYDSMLMKAKLNYIGRDRSGAVEILENIREIHGVRFEIERLLGNIAYEAGDTGKAIEAYHNCLRIDSSYPYIQYRYGTLLARELRYADAEEAFRKALELDPGFAVPALELAEIYVNSKRPNEAVPVLEDVVAVDPRNDDALVALAQVYLMTGRYDDGIRLVEGRRQRTPLPRDAEVLRGRLYYEAKEYEEAIEVFEGLLKVEKNSPELARILGEIYLKAGDADRSKEYFDEAIAMDPSDYQSYIGKFFAASPNFNDAGLTIDLSPQERAELLDEASALVEVTDFESNYLFGVSYLSLDSLAMAKSYLLRAKEFKGDDRGTLLNLASVYEKLEEFEDAEPCLAKLYELDPDDATVCNFYGYLLTEMRKDLEFAEKLVLKALESDPENGYYLDSLGWVYYQMGEYAKAVVEIEKALLRVSDDPIILEHLGDAYRAMRRFDEARAAYQKSNRLQDGNSEIIEKIQSTTPKNQH